MKACPTPASGAPVTRLKLVIMSATLQVETFRDNARLFAAPPPVITVDARQFPVVTHFTRRTPIDHLKAAYRKCVQIHSTLPPGGILVFLTGEQEIEDACKKTKAEIEQLGEARRRPRVLREQVVVLLRDVLGLGLS